MRVFFILFLIVNLFTYSDDACAESVVLQQIEVPDLDETLAKNIRAYLQSVINKPFDQIDSDYVQKQSQNALQAYGYYAPEITLSWADEGKSLVIKVVLNQQLVWNRVTITLSGQAQDDEALSELQQQLPLKVGNPVAHSDYETSKKQLEDTLLERGYFDFKWVRNQLRISKSNSRASAQLSIHSGPRYQFGPINITGSQIAELFIRDLAPFRTGDPFYSEQLSEYNVALNETPYFNSVRIYPMLNNRKDNEVPIHVEVVNKPANSFEVGGGFSTDLGAKARFKWSKPWITKDGHYLDSNLSISQKQRDITTSYTIPVGDPIQDLWRLSSGYKLEDELVDDNFSEVLTVQLQRQWLTSSNWVRTAFIRREKENYRIEDMSRTTHMTIPGISWAIKEKRGGTLPTHGEEHLFAIEGATERLASSSNMLRLQWRSAWLTSFERHYLYSRLDLGAIVSKDITDIPYSLRFYAGGDQSIRGYSYQSITPEENGEKTGGRYLVTSALEYQYQFAEKWRAALFVDAGTATNDFSEGVSVGAGLGIRYLTPIGPIRFDHAWALSKENSSTRLSIVIGPEL